MTEQQAIKAIQNDLEWHSKELKPAYKEVLKMAIQALEEIQQYRAIGTVEEIKKTLHNMSVLLASYTTNGTAEEFRDLKEKDTPKKPIYSDFDENEAEEIIPYKAVCPICEYEFEFGTWNDEENHHCVCGQAIDWNK